MKRNGRLIEVIKDAKEVRVERWIDDNGDLFYRKQFLNEFGESSWLSREGRLLNWLNAMLEYPTGLVRQRGIIWATDGSTDVLETHDAGIPVSTWSGIYLESPRNNAIHYDTPFYLAWNWWALMAQMLHVLQGMHELDLIHIDLKSNNVCIPVRWVKPKRGSPGRGRKFRLDIERLCLIDFTHALRKDDPLEQPLPLGIDRQYQSVMLQDAIAYDHSVNRPIRTNKLDWRVDLYSLGRMMEGLLPSYCPAGSGWDERLRNLAIEFLEELKGLDRPDLPKPDEMPHAEWKRQAEIARASVPQTVNEWVTDAEGYALLRPQAKRRVSQPLVSLKDNWASKLRPVRVSPAQLLKLLLMAGSVVIAIMLIDKTNPW